MTTIRKVLCPTDCSDASKPALEYAHFIAKTFGSELHVLHVWHVSRELRPDLSVWVDAGGQKPIATFVAEEAAAEANRFVSAMAPEIRDTIKLHVEEGEAWKTICDTAEHSAFDLIVMGTHGRTGLAHLALGSVAEKVVRHARCPILTVRMPAGK